MEVLKDLRIHYLTVIGQSVESGVIFCYHTTKRRIICFDQHAADERVRYEYLLGEVDYSSRKSDSIKTKACHTAIRFGDKLTLGQCQSLIERLLKCKNPFRCAHSRFNVCILESLDKILFIEQLRVHQMCSSSTDDTDMNEDNSDNIQLVEIN